MNIYMNADNMVRLPGCYDVHWPDYMGWLWAHWDSVPSYERAKNLAGVKGPREMTEKYTRDPAEALSVSPMWIVAYIKDGWYLVDLELCEKLSGPFRHFHEAAESAETRGYRVAQGWPP